MSGRPMPFRSGDDAARAAVAPLLNELRGELLVLPRDDVVEKHLDMMTFERRVLATPRGEHPVRRVVHRSRRTAFVFGCIAATIASCGLSAAGALPEPLQHITDSIAHTLGVPQPHDSGTSTGAGALEPDTTTPPTVHPRVSTPTTLSTAPTTPPTTAPRTPQATTPSTEPTAPQATAPDVPAAPPAFPARPTDPSGRITPTPPTTTPPPSNNSENTPPGYPTDWRDQAIDSATSQVIVCTWWDVLSPPNCPQSAVAPGAENVSWRLLSNPSRTAAAVAETTKSPNGDTSTLVTVYVRFRMVATYTLPATGTKQYLAYSSGIAEATMTWGGSMFGNVQLKPGSVAGHVMPGVTVPTFAHPDLWDASVAWEVELAFERCTANGTPDATCPAGGLLDAPSTNQSTLKGDVISSSEVGFDGETGLYHVTGPYTLTPPTGPAVTGIFRATLFYDGHNLTILSVTGR